MKAGEQLTALSQGIWGELHFEYYCFFSIALFTDLPAESMHREEMEATEAPPGSLKKKIISWGHIIKMGWKWDRKHVEEAAMIRQFTYCVKQKKKFV